MREPKFINYMRILDGILSKMPNSLTDIYKENIETIDGKITSKVSYSYLFYLVEYLRKRGMVDKRKEGRNSIISLTKDGKYLYEFVRGMLILIDNKKGDLNGNG